LVGVRYDRDQPTRARPSQKKRSAGTPELAKRRRIADLLSNQGRTARVERSDRRKNFRETFAAREWRRDQRAPPRLSAARPEFLRSGWRHNGGRARARVRHHRFTRRPERPRRNHRRRERRRNPRRSLRPVLHRQMNAESFYEHLVRPVLFSLSAEGAHNVAIRNLRIASNWPAALRQLERFKPPPKPTTAFGLT